MLDVKEVCSRAKAASRELAVWSTDDKNRILREIGAAILEKEHELLEYNRTDVLMATDNHRPAALIDRLRLDHRRIALMVEGLNQVADLPDPVGEVVDEYTTESGLRIQRKRAPLGVVAIIYEARPNVTVDSSALAIKSGNAVILRGSKDSQRTNFALIDIMRKTIKKLGYNNDIISYIESASYEQVDELLSMDQYVDVVIPRGGEKLKATIRSKATMPVIASAGGNCHVYVDKYADIEKAYAVLDNGKTQRPSVCNATETLLVHVDIAYKFLTYALPRLKEKGVEIRGTANIKSVFPDTVVVNDAEFFKEYEAMILKVRAVKNVEDAIALVNHYGTHHSDCICTEDAATAEKFLNGVDSAAVYCNASTRFTDGFEMGLGAEMGISTQKLHCRGPIGLRELTSVKYVVYGDGTIRQ